MGVCAWGCPSLESSLFEERMVLGERSPQPPAQGRGRLCSGGQPHALFPWPQPSPLPVPTSSPPWTAALSPGFSVGSAPHNWPGGAGTSELGRPLSAGGWPGGPGCRGLPWRCRGWGLSRLGSSPGPSATEQGLILQRAQSPRGDRAPQMETHGTHVHARTTRLPWWVSVPRD